MQIHISGNHYLLFNPVGSGGPVVVNSHGLGLFQRFNQIELVEFAA